MNKKHVLMFLLLSLILISLSCVNAENHTSSDVTRSVSNENILESSDLSVSDDNYELTKNIPDSIKTDYSQTHEVSNSDDLDNVLSTAEDLTGKHIIELKNKELIIKKEFYIFNDDLELIFNGNGNRLNLENSLSFSVKNVVFNNLIIEFDDDVESRDIIENYGNMSLDNVTIKNTKEYDKMVSVFKENAYYDFDDWDGVEKTFSYSTRSMNLNNKGKLYVNNSHFINNSGESATAIYNDGIINVENTVFEDSLGKFGIIYTNNNSIIKNCEFINNKVFQQLLLTHGNCELINNTFRNNKITGGAILDNRGIINIKDCEFTNNKAKYELVDNWVYMDASNLSLCNNTCDILINSFGNLTLKNSFIKDNTCNSSIICRDTTYIDPENNIIDKAGNVTLIGNKIFRGNVEYTDFFNNHDTGSISLYNNTIYDKPDYDGDCLFDGNTFIEDKTLYDDNGNYHGLKREIEIWHYINYVIVNQEYDGAVFNINHIEDINLGESINVKGRLTDKNDKGISNKEIFLSITDNEYNVKVFNPITDENGWFTVNYTPVIYGQHTINAFYKSEDEYDVADEYIDVYVNDASIEKIITIDNVPDLYLGESVEISGEYKDSNDNPMMGKLLTLRVIGTDTSQQGYGDPLYTQTDEYGRFSFMFTPCKLGVNVINVFDYNLRVMNNTTVTVLENNTDNTQKHDDTENTENDENLIETIITIDPLPKKVQIFENLTITGILTDINNNPLSNKPVHILIETGSSDMGIETFEFDTVSDENGKYSLNYAPTTLERLTVEALFYNDSKYLSTPLFSATTTSWVDRVETITRLDPVPSKVNVGDDIVISCTLSDINDNPLKQEMYIHFRDENELLFYTFVTTDENGRFTYIYKVEQPGNLYISTAPSDDNYYTSSDYVCVNVTDNEPVEDNNTNSESIETNETVETNTTRVDDNKNNNNQTIIIDNSIKSDDNNNTKTIKISKYKVRNNKLVYKSFKKSVLKSSDKMIIKHDKYITLSWLNNLFNHRFNKKELLIYIDNILVFNGTVSDNSSEVLFRVLEEYEGEHLLKVVENNDTYQKEVVII